MLNKKSKKERSQNIGKKKKTWLIPVIIILFSTSLTLLGADLVLRLFGGRLLYYRPHEMFIEKCPELPLVSRYKKNVSYEGEAFGDLAAMQSDVHLRQKRRIVFETDAFGFRNSCQAGNDDVYDVIILGDSFGAGLGITQNRNWVSQLKERHGIDAYNLSIPGGSPWQGYVHFATEASRLRVHSESIVLVTVFSGNDLDDYYYEDDVELSALPWNDAWGTLGVRVNSFVKRSPIVQLMGRFRHGNSSAGKVLIRDFPDGRSMLFYEPYVTSSNRTVEMVREHENYPRLLNTIRGISEVAQDHGIMVVVVLFPSKEEVYGWVVEENPPRSQGQRQKKNQGGLGMALEASCGQDRIRFVDLTSSLVAIAEREREVSGGFIYWTDDTHWNETGHGIVADVIHETIFSPLQ